MMYKVENIASRTEADYLAVYKRLPFERRQRVDKYRNKDDRYRSVFAFELLMNILEDAYGIRAEQAEFYTDEKGKPHLKGDSVHFSLSHSGDYVACAVSANPVGIDIEVPRTITSNVIKRVCIGRELDYIKDGDSESEQEARFLHIWTAKEAYLKYRGVGLSGGFDCVELIPAEDGFVLNTGHNLKTERGHDFVVSIVW